VAERSQTRHRTDGVGQVWGVVFDLDGTLVDSGVDITRAINRMLSDHRLTGLEPAQVEPLLGEGARSLVSSVYDILGVPVSPERLTQDTTRYLEHYAEEPVRDSVLYRDARPALAELAAQGVRLGICTNKNEGLAVRVLTELAVDHFFSTVVGGDSLAVRKPEPEHLLTAVRNLDLPAAQTLFVGDSRIDAECARRADVRCLLVDWGVPDPDCARLRRFGDLVQHLRPPGVAGLPAPSTAKDPR
jgi:phosphoglycolate phosphatase